MKPFFESMNTEQRARVQKLESCFSLWAVFLDPPYHTRLRRLPNRGFTSRAVNGKGKRLVIVRRNRLYIARGERHGAHIADITHETINRVSDRAEIDFIHDIAYRIPAAVIMEMLGTPPARLEGRIALPILAQRMRNPGLIAPNPEWLDNLSFRGLSKLTMTCDFVA